MTIASKALLLALSLYLGGCASVQYKTLEQVGIHKRDILVDRIEDARDAQNDTKEQVVSAYEKFRTLVKVNDGGLEKRYKAMAREVERSESEAEALDERISSVEQVANDLFVEWKNELGQYSSASLRATSARNLQTTQTQYNHLRQRMRSAQKKITPVLHVLQDHTLYLKHNLNSRAVASLQSEVGSIEAKVGVLVAEMEAAVNEAEAFIGTMGR